MSANCTECGSPLDPRGRNKSGICRLCHIAIRNRDPEFGKKVSAAMRRSLAHDPAKLEAYRKRILAVRSSPKATASRSRVARETQMWIKGNASQPKGSPSRMKAGARGSATKLSWCPPHLRDDYRFLTNRKRFKAAEARQMIEEQHEFEMARWRRSIGIVDEVKPSAAERIGDLLDDGEERDPFLRALTAASVAFNVDTDGILSADRSPCFTTPRFAIALVMRRRGRSTVDIAASLHRSDHSSAIHWCKKGEEREAEDNDFAANVSLIEAAWDGDSGWRDAA